MPHRAWLCTLALTLLAPGCGADDETQLRAAFESLRSAGSARDHAAMWDLMATSYRDALARQLEDFRGIGPESRRRAAVENALSRFGLSLEAVRDLDTRAYFLAMLEGLQRLQPGFTEMRVEVLRSAEIVSIEIEGDSATITIETALGATDRIPWVREGGGWKTSMEGE